MHPQIAATVVSKAGTRCNFDRSLMYRLMNAGQSFGMLRSQYRMHPQIARFPSACFYRGQLESAGPTVRMPRGASLSTWNGTVGALPPYVVVDTSEGGESRWDSGSASCSNQCEAHLALRLAEALAATRGDDEGHICILSFYQGQVRLLCNGMDAALRKLHNSGRLSVQTVDSFQGSEADTVILSCVRTGHIGFLADDRRLNVALTRAKRRLIVLASADCLQNAAEAQKRPSALAQMLVDAQQRRLVLPSRDVSGSFLAETTQSL